MRKRTPPILIALAWATLFALPAWARNPVLETDASSDAAKTGGALLSSTDPVCLYAEDFSQGEAGWTPGDLAINQDGIFWQRTAHAPGGFGSRGVMWCGTYIAGDPLNPAGYGNFWLQYLTKPFQLPAWNASIEFSIQYDTEPSYDFVSLRVSTDGGTTWAEWMSLSGRSMDIDVDDGVQDGFITYNVDLTAYTNQNVLIRFMFLSDTSWSDADMLYPSDGACRLDWVRVSGYATDDFESNENGWVASIPVAEPAAFRLVDRPVCTNPALPCDTYCNTWVAYDPVTGVFPWRDDLENPGGR